MPGDLFRHIPVDTGADQIAGCRAPHIVQKQIRDASGSCQLILRLAEIFHRSSITPCEDWISWPLTFNARLRQIVNVLSHFHNPPVAALSDFARSRGSKS